MGQHPGSDLPGVLRAVGGGQRRVLFLHPSLYPECAGLAVPKFGVFLRHRVFLRCVHHRPGVFRQAAVPHPEVRRRARGGGPVRGTEIPHPAEAGRTAGEDTLPVPVPLRQPAGRSPAGGGGDVGAPFPQGVGYK